MRKRIFWVWEEVDVRVYVGNVEGVFRVGCNMEGKIRDYDKYNGKSRLEF